MKKFLLLLFFTISMFFINRPRAQSPGDYRSAANGNWSDASTWEMFDGVGWITAVLPPTPLSGVITIKDSVVVNGSDSADQVVITPAGILNILAGDTFRLFNGNGTDMQCDGKLIVGVGANLLNSTETATVNYTGTLLQLDGAFNPETTFSGSATQMITGISGSGYFGAVINLDNAQNLIIAGSTGFAGVNFINGKVLAPGSFTIGQYSGNNFTGQDATKYIDGNVDCIVFDQTPATFNLPMGKNGHYLPLTFFVQTSAGAPETGFVVSINDGPPTTLALPPDLNRVSDVRYYTITNPGAVSIDTAMLQLAYDSTDGVTDPVHLRIARSTDAGWVNEGGEGTAEKNGTIQSDVNFKVLGNFVLANDKEGSNPLPVHFTAFTAEFVKQSSVQLRWTTTNEVNTARFAVERKDANGTAWLTVGNVPAGRAGGDYSYLDAPVLANGGYLYRITEVDKDGLIYRSNTLLVRAGSTSMRVSMVYPNPVKNILHYYIALPGNSVVNVAVTTAGGKTLQLQKAQANQVLDIKVDNLPAGTYFITFINQANGKRVTKKFIKQ
ncbi:MAG TPA: T9SS type A sorting domain-containing protein [Chitinophagaceae bacterium]|nr:T9SS type A sorting domain-containing protein [Chitinophagaceae bacterium]